MSDRVGITIILLGRVQGVMLRRGIKTRADALGLSGFAENKEDGTVRIVAEGPRERVQKLLNWCYKGTNLANVQGLEFRWEAPYLSRAGFSIIRRGTYIADKFAALKNLSKGIHGMSPVTLILPKHVAVIPDGNRRWAKERNLPTFQGHKKGVENSINLFNEAQRLGIPYFTWWGFSTENWNRSNQEIKFLMQIFKNYLEKLKKKLREEEIHFRHFGRRDRLPKPVILLLSELEKLTDGFSKANLGLALDYGGRDEILRAIKKMEMDKTSISKESFEHALDTGGFPDPDLIIRTSGEQRLSGFMPWQGTYAELYFAKENFPAFGVPEFQAALADFGKRKRNFGK
jgi:undecaprenyl diphosphate synthase